MRTTVDIPDETYRALKVMAAERGTTVRELLLDGLKTSLGLANTPERKSQRPRFPLIRSTRPGSLKLGEEGVYEYIPFP
jgi:hypothetical protein